MKKHVKRMKVKERKRKYNEKDNRRRKKRENKMEEIYRRMR